MGALIGGFLSVFVGVLVFGFLFNNPAIIVALVVVFVFIAVLGFINGSKNKVTLPPNISTKSGGQTSEGDIRHHYDASGTPMNISDPHTIQNESMSFRDDEEHN